jgi:hypothetical protein
MRETLGRILLTSDGAVMALRPSPDSYVRTERQTPSRAPQIAQALEGWGPGRSRTRQRSRLSTAPTSDLATIVDEMDKRYARCRTHRTRLTVIKEAQAVSENLRYAPKANGNDRGTKKWREALANDPRPRRIIARDYGVSSKTITAARKEFGR